MSSTDFLITNEIVVRRVQNAGAFLFRLFTAFFATYFFFIAKFIYGALAKEVRGSWAFVLAFAGRLLFLDSVPIFITIITEFVFRSTLLDQVESLSLLTCFQLSEELV